MGTRGINEVTIIGNLCKAPESRTFESGTTKTKLLVATTDTWMNKETNQREEETEFHNVVLWRKQAEIARDHLQKGRQIYIKGRLKTRKWQDKETGKNRYMTEIAASDMQMLGGRGYDTPDQAPPDNQQPQHQSHDGFDDDVPV